MKSKKATTDPVWMVRVKSIKGGSKYVDKIGKLIKYNPALEKAISNNDQTFRWIFLLMLLGELSQWEAKSKDQTIRG